MLLSFERNRTLTIIVMYSLYLFLGFSLRNTSKALGSFRDSKEVFIHIEVDSNVWFFISYLQKKKVSVFKDETMIQIGDQNYILWICIEPLHNLYSSLEKSLIERVVHYFKDRNESFDDYYP